MSAHDTTAPRAAKAAPVVSSSRGLPFWAKALIYLSVMAALALAAQAWLA